MQLFERPLDSGGRQHQYFGAVDGQAPGQFGKAHVMQVIKPTFMLATAMNGSNFLAGNDMC